MDLKQEPLEGIKCKNYMTKFISNPLDAVPRMDYWGSRPARRLFRKLRQDMWVAAVAVGISGGFQIYFEGRADRIS